MENDFQRHVAEWREMNQMGRFAEARQYYFEQLFEEVIDNFVKQNGNLFPYGSNVDVLFSVLGFTPEPIILAAKALNPKRHIIFHDSGVKFNEDNMRYLSRFLDNGFEKIELPNESFSTIYDVFKSKMALTAGRNYAINVSGGKKSMVAAASIFARDFNCSVIYVDVDHHNYDANLRRPIPGTEYLNVVYTPLRDLPELFHIGMNHASPDKENAKDSKSAVGDNTEMLSQSEQDFNATKTHSEATGYSLEVASSEESTEIEYNISSILHNSDWSALKDYLNKNLQGSNIPKIQFEVTCALNTFTSSTKYWETVEVLLSYNPIIFLGAISKAEIPNISNLGTGFNSTIINSIISNAFQNSGKLKFALDLLMPCKALLSKEHRELIMNSCQSLTSSDLFYTLFKLTGINPSVSIDYLLNIQSTAAAFTLYRIFSDGLKNGLVREDSPIESLRTSEIAKYCERMQESESYAVRTSALLIKNRILSKGRIDRVLINEIEKSGFDGFHRYITIKEQNIKSENVASSLSVGDLLTRLRFIKSLDNYFLFIDNESQSYALLDKNLTDKLPSSDVVYQAFVQGIKKHNGKNVFFISKEEDSISLSYPPLINNGSTFDISFSQGKNGIWYLVKNNYCKLLTIEIGSKPMHIDYRKKQKARIVQSIDFFTYKVEIL